MEAGLRSYNKYSPFPEEVNRILISHLADYHFAPTEAAKENFFKEGIKNNVQIIYPVHLNPSVKKTTSEIIKNMQNVHLIPPVDYFHLVWLMDKAYLVITDSGGIQEEAPSLGKPVLVIRDVTERVEGIKAGTARLIGTDKEKIVNEVEKLLNDKTEYGKMARIVNPYGDGNSSGRIVRILMENVG